VVFLFRTLSSHPKTKTKSDNPLNKQPTRVLEFDRPGKSNFRTYPQCFTIIKHHSTGYCSIYTHTEDVFV
jgi:hypothetical protein